MYDGLKEGQINFILNANKIAIYGTGFVANQFYNILCMRGLKDNIKYFVVSNEIKEKKYMYDIPVKSVLEVKEENDLVICIAVHEILLKEIIHALKCHNQKNYIWIYPYLHEMMMGLPIEKNVPIQVTKVIRNCKDYRIAIRNLVIENYYSMNDCGFNIYVKSMELICNKKETAQKKLYKFCELIEDWEKNGCRKNSRILITNKYELFDGAHRLAVANFHKEKEILGNIYQSDPILYKYYGANEFTRKEVIYGGKFSKNEIEMIEDSYKRLKAIK